MKRLKSKKDFGCRQIRADADRPILTERSDTTSPDFLVGTIPHFLQVLCYCFQFIKDVFCKRGDTASPDFLVGTILHNCLFSYFLLPPFAFSLILCWRQGLLDTEWGVVVQ